MKEYLVAIKESVVHYIYVDANSPEEAEQKAIDYPYKSYDNVTQEILEVTPQDE